MLRLIACQELLWRDVLQVKARMTVWCCTEVLSRLRHPCRTKRTPIFGTKLGEEGLEGWSGNEWMAIMSPSRDIIYPDTIPSPVILVYSLDQEKEG